MVLPITRKNLALRSIFSDLQIIALGDFPGGPVVKNPPCNSGDADSIPGWETKIPYAEKQLSPRTTSRETPCAAITETHML